MCSDSILLTVDNILRQLGIKRENFALLLPNATCYMSPAGKTLKELYPPSMHVTCIAYLPHNCTTQMQAYFLKY